MLIDRPCASVLSVRENPHSIATTFSSKCPQSLDERTANPPSLKSCLYGQLVQEHLGSFVRMSHLDTADVPRRVVSLVGNEKVMTIHREKMPRGFSNGRTIEQMGRHCDKFAVPVTQ